MPDLKVQLARMFGDFMTEVVENVADAALEVVQERLDGATAKVGETRKKVRRKRAKKITVEVRNK
jgi:hypothetical protein